MTELKAGTVVGEIARANAQAELDAINAEDGQLRQKLPSLTGEDRTTALRSLAELEWRRVRVEATVQQFTFDEPKRLRAGVCSEDEIKAAIDKVPFAHTTTRTFLGYGVDGSADPIFCESIAIAISRLKTAAHARVMDYVRCRAAAAPRNLDEPMVW